MASRVGRSVGVALLAVVLWSGASPAAFAQTSSAASTARPTEAAIGFLTSYRFHLNAFRVLSADDALVWDTDFGGDLDVFDLDYFRGNVLVNYEGIIGDQIRAIDPNQGNYTIDLSAWWRTVLPDSELGATFHHVSRHLSDRDKEFAIAWNMVGLQYTSTMRLRGWSVDVGYRLLKTVRKSFVDYTAELGGSLEATRGVHPRAVLVLAGELMVVPVERRLRDRGPQYGGRIELGVRFPGGAGAGEIFVSHERRIDADPFDLEPTTFTMLGFRFLSH